ncbi:MAG: polymer-forming cytoskeletal protein [Parvibaculum sp.]|nr:polymer-forming cytoskeletal protein [Parvibaculum sp.]
MFKRPKGVSDPDLSAPPSPQERDAASHNARAEATGDDGTDKGTRIITPSYQARKPAVRTLHTPGGQPSATTPAHAANLHVGRGLKLEGKIQSCDALVIEGDVQATIESGTLTISETGEVRGEATVDEAEINGKFDGTLTVRKCLTINTTGRINGKVRYGELRVEQGGQISGEIQAEDAKDAPSRPASVKAAESGETKSDSGASAGSTGSERAASLN